MKRKTDYNDSLSWFLMHFIFAGSSALIISIAYIFTDYWFVYVFALLPFLYRVINTDLKGSLISGVFLALSFVFVVFSSRFISSPAVFAVRILLLCLTFAAFSVVINRLKKYFALSFLLFVILCYPLEYFHKSYFEFNSVIASLKNDVGFAFRAASLLSIIFISFVLIAINSLLLFLIDVICRLAPSRRFFWPINKSLLYRWADDRTFLKQWKCLPCLRAPPRRF